MVRTHDAGTSLNAINPSTTTIVTIANIPAGSYVITGKTVAANFTTTDDFVRCFIYADTNQVDGTATYTSTNAGALRTAPLTMIGAYTAASAFTATLRCSLDDPPPSPGPPTAGIYVESSRLVATAVGGLSVGPS
jgi:hypothetical protein